MSYSTSSLKISLGLAVLENSKLNKDQKIAMMEFIEKGTDAQIRHLALTGEVKYKYTLAEKKKLSEKINSVRLSENIKSLIKEEDEDYARHPVRSAVRKGVQAGIEHGGKAVKAAREYGGQAAQHVASGAQKVSDFANQHTGGHGTAAMAAAGGAALVGGAAALLARRRAKKKAEAAAAAKKK